MRKVHIVGGGFDYSFMFQSMGWAIVSNHSEADLVCFTGGEDVSPELYGQKKHRATFNNIYRDEREKAIFEECRHLSIPMVGICRGGQFLNVMSGGEMYQHVGNHGGGHNIIDVDTGEEIFASSTHHQMFKPSENAIIVAISNLGGFREWYDGGVFKRDESNTDYEVIYYPETNCLCFQPHPEFGHKMYDDLRNYFNRCVESYLVDSTVINVLEAV